MSGHTPGPWILTDGDRFESSCVITTHLRLGESMASIAEVETDWIEPFGSEQRANTRLIAAAPDLLAVVEAMAFELNLHLSAGNNSPFSSDTTLRTRAAIAKATGEAA